MQEFEFVDTRGETSRVRADNPEAAMKLAENIAPDSGVRAIPADQLAVSQPIPQTPDAPRSEFLTDAPPPEPQTPRQGLEQQLGRLMQDTGPDREVMREELQIEQKRERANQLAVQIRERQRSYQDQIEEIERNPRGATRAQQNARINELSQKASRELADLNFSYSIANDDYNNAQRIMQERIEDHQRQRQWEMAVFQQLFNFVQWDSEEQRRDAQEAVRQRERQEDMQFQMEMAQFNSQLRMQEQSVQFQRQQQAQLQQQAQQQQAIMSLFSPQQPQISFEDYVAAIEEENQMSLAPDVIESLRMDFNQQMAQPVDEMAQINQAVMMGLISPAQANFMIDNMEITTPQQRQRQAQVIETGRGVLRDIDRALESVNLATPGIRGLAAERATEAGRNLFGTIAAQQLTGLPFTGARGERLQLARDLESIKSNLSIEELQRMRENSPTGGALGQVPVQQQQYLMSLKGSLSVAMSPDVLQTNLQDLYNVYLDAMFGTPQELSQAVRQGRMTSQEANAFLNQRKQSSFDEFNLPTASSQGQPIDNLQIAPDGTLIQLR